MSEQLGATDTATATAARIDAATTPTKLDPTVPNVARMYDYFLGGKDNYAADRTAADEVIARMPLTREVARANRAFLGRAVRYLAAEASISQFIDIGAGLPTQDNVHQVAQRANPDARVVYVDLDAVVMNHARGILARNQQTVAIVGDVRKPAAILADPELNGLLDLSRPVALLMVALLHFIPDDQGAYEAVAALVDALAPGSYLVISHIGNLPELEDAATVYKKANAPVVLRTAPEISCFLDGLTLVDPGVVKVREWRPDPDASDADPLEPDVPFYGGVAVKEAVG
ncbi:SAM-dependent methyltransferase [Streptosporangiaceae bacterium NEAU-GS5]|nr:SAM-dependent methyltransferase [Streptosporangiaceae bacterium NEAU-GS5]